MKFENTIYESFDLQRSILIPKEEKMTNFLTSDVRTYVTELISKEFGSTDNEDNAHLENRKLTNREHQKQQKQTAAFGQKIQDGND